MHYPTHSIGGLLSVMSTRLTKVSAVGFVQPDDDWFRRDTRSGNVFSNETALFHCANAAAVRICEYRRIGHTGSEAFRLFGTDASFTYELFVERYNSDLANGLGNLLSRVASLAKRNLDGLVPEPPADVLVFQMEEALAAKLAEDYARQGHFDSPWAETVANNVNYKCSMECILLKGTLNNDVELKKQAYKEWGMKETIEIITVT